MPDDSLFRGLVLYPKGPTGASESPDEWPRFLLFGPGPGMSVGFPTGHTLDNDFLN